MEWSWLSFGVGIAWGACCGLVGAVWGIKAAFKRMEGRR